jgi:hypothetical protein
LIHIRIRVVPLGRNRSIEYRPGARRNPAPPGTIFLPRVHRTPDADADAHAAVFAAAADDLLG